MIRDPKAIEYPSKPFPVLQCIVGKFIKILTICINPFDRDFSIIFEEEWFSHKLCIKCPIDFEWPDKKISIEKIIYKTVTSVSEVLVSENIETGKSLKNLRICAQRPTDSWKYISYIDFFEFDDSKISCSYIDLLQFFDECDHVRENFYVRTSKNKKDIKCLETQTITGFSINEDKDTIHLETEDGIIVGEFERSCCESVWIEHIEDIDNLIGEEVIEVKEYDIISKIEIDEDDEEDEHRHLEILRVDINTRKGSTSLEFRNNHNGYYGGISMCFTFIPKEEKCQNE